MSEEPAPPIVILCAAGAAFDCLIDLAARRLVGVADRVVVVPLETDPSDAVRRARADHGEAPLGVVVKDDATVLAALEAGADEAIAGTTLDNQAAFAFIDRVTLRGRLRHEQEKMRASYVHAEKLAALGNLVAGVAHEINNPLTALLLSVEALQTLPPVDEGGRTEDPEARELIQEIGTSAVRIADVVQDLKIFSRQEDDVTPEIIDPRALLDQVLRIVGRQIRATGTLEIDHEQHLPVVVAPASRLAQVLTNVLLNAAQAIAEIARPSHRVRISTRSDEEAVAICVTDTGPGIPAEVVGRIFDPFFTTKRPGVGTGLGLSISRSIMRRMGGDLLVESVHGDGATFIALVPRPSERDLREAKPLRAAPKPFVTRPSPRRCVLLVDADELVLRAFARALDAQHDVLLARDAEEAIGYLSTGSQVDLLVADVSLPQSSGMTLFRWLTAQRPQLTSRLAFVTAEDPVRPAIAEVGVPVLQKPVSRGALLAVLARLAQD